MPKKSDAPLLSPKFALALQFANEIHGTQTRKGAGAPYISHLMGPGPRVRRRRNAGHALLHDSAEDCGGRPMLETVRLLFGAEVAAIVEACTDTFDDPKPAWRPRKEAYLAVMASKPASAKLVACADKLHNISNTLRDIQAEGVEPWKRRMAESPNGAAEKQAWYYLGCLQALSVRWQSPILDEFARAVLQFCQQVGSVEDVERAETFAGRRP